MGPTASGKSDVAEKVADQLGLSLINADAFMIYKGLDIGTNKPTRRGDYALLDLIEPHQDFGVGEYVVRASDELQRHWSEKKGAVIVGGTGFYIRALLEQYDDLMPPPDPKLRAELMNLQASNGVEGLAKTLLERTPEVAKNMDLKNPVRVRRALERALDPRPPIKFSLPAFKIRKFVLDPTGIDDLIELRAKYMIENGWIEEVRHLLGKNIDPGAPGFRAIGYDYIIGIVNGTVTREEALLGIVRESRQYARRQRTWLRGEPRVTKTFVGDTSADFSAASAKEIVDYCFV